MCVQLSVDDMHLYVDDEIRHSAQALSVLIR